jgi:hypothetical protein
MGAAFFGTPTTLGDRLNKDRDCLRALKREIQRTAKRKEKEIATLDIIIHNAFHANNTNLGQRKVREQVLLEKSVERYSHEIAMLDEALEVTDIQRIKIATQQAMIRTTRVLVSMLHRYPNSAMTQIMAMYSVSSDTLDARQKEIHSTYEGVLDTTDVPETEGEEEGEDIESIVKTRCAKYTDARAIQDYHETDAAIGEARKTQQLNKEDEDLTRRLMQLSSSSPKNRK